MSASQLLFDGWASVGRTVFVGVCSYLVLLLILRTSGKRTIAKMNAYDLIITVALGSTLASALTSNDVVLAEAATAFVVLAGLQFLLSWLSVRFARVRGWITGGPTLLLHRGEMLRGAMRGERITEAELLAAVRVHGIASLREVEAVVLETDGSFSVLRNPAESAEGSLRDVPDYHAE